MQQDVGGKRAHSRSCSRPAVGPALPQPTPPPTSGLNGSSEGAAAASSGRSMRRLCTMGFMVVSVGCHTSCASGSGAASPPPAPGKHALLSTREDCGAPELCTFCVQQAGQAPPQPLSPSPPLPPLTLPCGCCGRQLRCLLMRHSLPAGGVQGRWAAIPECLVLACTATTRQLTPLPAVAIQASHQAQPQVKAPPWPSAHRCRASQALFLP